ncbi:MAG: heme exporter protein CcmD [Pseudomonadota bacterium]
MLEDLPRHAGFVIASYAIVVIALGGLGIWMVHARRTQARLLKALGQGSEPGRSGALQRSHHE